MNHEWQRSRITGTTTCAKCGLLPLDEDDHSSNCPRYQYRSEGNGARYEIKRLADGATLFLQGDDAVQFSNELDKTHDRWTDDDVCAQYDELFES